MHDQEVTSLDDQRTLSSEEIRQALLSRDLETLEDLFDRLWYQLPDRFSTEIISATSSLGPHELDRRPRLLHVTLLAHGQQHFARGDTALRKIVHYFGTYGRRFASRLSTYRDPRDLLAAGTLAVISARLRGSYDDSERLGSWVDQQLALRVGSHMLPWGSTSTAARPGWLSCQRGVTATLSGNLESAVDHYTRAHAEAGTAPTEHYAGANAAANLAMLAAFQGHLDLARQWLLTLDEMGDVPDWIEQVTNIGAKIARALIAIEEGDAEGASEHLVTVGSATQAIELWPFAAFAHASYDAHFGDPHHGLRQLQEARFVHSTHIPTSGGIADQLTLRAEAKLLLRAQTGHRILALARENPDEHSLQHQVAWVYLLAGDYQQAIRAAAKVLNRLHLPRTDMISAHLVLAIAHLREGNHDRAAHAFETAVRQRCSPALIGPFLSASSEDLEQLSQLARVPNPLASTRISIRSNPPSAGSIVRLTRREQAVLEALEGGGTAEQTAADFGVAVSTVRSQVRSLYKKLGVAKRAAALARAHELGLLSESRQSGR